MPPSKRITISATTAIRSTSDRRQAAEPGPDVGRDRRGDEEDGRRRDGEELGQLVRADAQRGTSRRRPGRSGRSRSARSPPILSQAVSTYSLIADLPVVVESYELEGLEQAVSSEFVRRTTVVRLHGGRRGGRRRGRDLRRRGPAALPGRGARASTSPASTRSTRSPPGSRACPTSGAGASRAPRSTSRSGRRDVRCTRCSAASRRPVTFVVSTSLPDGRVGPAARAPGHALQARPGGELERGARRELVDAGRGGRGRLQGGVRLARARADPAARASTGSSSRRCRTR